MKYDGNRLLRFEWIVCIAWSVFWGALGYIAISERAITLGGRLGIHSSEGAAAIVAGFMSIAAALAGIGWLCRTSPFRRQLRLLLCLAWAAGLGMYFLFLHPAGG